MADFWWPVPRKLGGCQGWDEGFKAEGSPKEAAERKRAALVQIIAGRGGLLGRSAFIEHLQLLSAAVGRGCWRRRS